MRTGNAPRPVPEGEPTLTSATGPYCAHLHLSPMDVLLAFVCPHCGRGIKIEPPVQ